MSPANCPDTVPMAAKMTVLDLLQRDLKEHEALELTCVGGRRGLTAQLHGPELNRPGLALGGFFDNFAYERIQVFGRGESAYLRKLAAEGATASLQEMISYHLPCSVFTHGIDPTEDYLRLSEAAGRAVLQTPLSTAEFTARVVRILALMFAPSLQVHGVMLEVFGMGVLIQGPSGVGKSEAALALVERGHRLVADDTVKLRLVDNVLYGSGAASHHMEIRGLGIINISYLFGVGAILDSKNVQLVVRLEDWDAAADYDRVGFGERTVEFLDVGVREVLIPVRPGRPIWILIETAAMNERLRHMGYYSGAEFTRNVTRWKERDRPQAVTIEEW